MNFDRALSLITMAGLAGLVVLNYQGSTALIKGLSDAATQYITAVQGR